MAFASNEDGAALVEYILLVTLIAMAVVGTLTTLGNNLNNRFTSIEAAMNN